MNIFENIPLRNIRYLDTMLATYADFSNFCKKYEGLEDEFKFLNENKRSLEEERKEQYRKIKEYCATMLKNNGSIKREYNHAKSSQFGRLFAPNSIQAIWKPFRGFLMSHTTDIDMKNAHPAILAYICKMNDISCPHLNEYIAKRDSILAKFEVSRDEAKRLFLCSINKDTLTRSSNAFFKSFDKEMKQIQKEIIALEEYSEIVATVPSGKTYNRTGSAINRILCEIENQILSVMIESIKKQNIDIAALMFDGIMVYGNFYDNQTLLESIEYDIDREFEGLDMKLSYKEHDATISIPSDFEEVETPAVSKKGVWTDMEAAETLYQLYPHWINCDDTLYVFNSDTGMWENNTTAYYIILRKFSDHLYELKETVDGDIIQMKTSYGNTETLMKKIPNLIKTLCVNNDWLKQNSDSSLGKLLFKNGIYDFKECKFYDKETYGFNPSIVFFGRIHRNFTFTESEIEYMNDVEERLFYSTLGREVGEYFILNLARGLAGETIDMKRMLFGLGSSNTGKGVLTNACMLSLGDYVGSFNAENLAYKEHSSQDEAQKLRWALLLRYKRIIFSNEIKSQCVLDGNQIKKISSGGDPLTGRTHCKEETEFVAHFLPVILANDLPRIEPYDKAVDVRLRVLNYNKTFVDEPSNVFELKKDDNIKHELKTTKFQDAFVNILIRKYTQYIDNGCVDIEPADVIQAKEDWVQQSSSPIELFLRDFEITNDKTDYIFSDIIDDWITSMKLGITIKKFSIEMKKYCVINKFDVVKSDDKKLNGKTRKAWFGIRVIEEVTEQTDEKL